VRVGEPDTEARVEFLDLLDGVRGAERSTILTATMGLLARIQAWFRGRSADAVPPAPAPPFTRHLMADENRPHRPDENRRVERCVVDNRVFLLGLDELYRRAMQQHERSELLGCARTVAGVLHVAAADVPVEGYYADEPELASYFQLVRALQATPGDRSVEVARLPEFRRLLVVCSAPLYGRPVDTGNLLPVGRDSLSHALGDVWPDWSVSRLTAAAYATARETDDFSLVGPAARAKDPVVLTVLRESVVLYAEVFLGCALPPRRAFVWAVEDELAKAARRFVDTFNALFGKRELPSPIRQNAEVYWRAYGLARILGRCVRLGQTEDRRYYHWAVCRAPNGELTVHEFWHEEIWTTQRYRVALDLHDRCPEV